MTAHGKQAASSQPIRLLVVDDHPVVLDALQEWLGRVKMFTVVGACNSAAEALACLADLSPEIVLIDVNKPQIRGVEAAPMIKQRNPAIRVVLMSLDDAQVAVARRLPSVDGAVHKEQLMDEFPPLVQRLFHP